MKHAGNKRQFKSFFLNKKQLAVVIVTTVYFGLSLIAVTAVVIAPSYSDIYQSNDELAKLKAAKDFILLSEKLAIAFAAIFVLTIVPLILVTHRIFGPLINFSNVFKRVADGDLTARVNLRRGDLLKSEALLANHMFQFLAMSISEVKEQNNHLVTTLNGIVEERRTRNDLGDGIIEARNHARTCETLLSRLQTADMSDQDQTPAESPEIPRPQEPK